MNWALLITSIVLVVATAVYTWHTRSMAAEMKATRLQTVAPQIALAMHAIGPTHSTIRLLNVGQGAACEVAVTLTIAPLNDERPWRTPLLQPGEWADFYLHNEETRDVMDMNTAQKRGVVASLAGVAFDIHGRRYEVRESIDIAAWWTDVVKSQQSYDDDPAVTANREREKTRKALEKVGNQLARLVAQGNSRATRPAEADRDDT